MRCDYHIHSEFSDGLMSVNDIISKSIEKDLQSICITDHYTKKIHSLPLEDLDYYFTKLTQLKNTVTEQDLGIELFVGIEVDYKYEIPLNEILQYNWDLLLFEYAMEGFNWEKKFKTVLTVCDQTNFSVGLAHTRFDWVPDTDYLKIQDQIVKHNLFIELNSSYKNWIDPWFDSLNKDISFTLGSDAHYLKDVGNIQPALKYLKKQNISFDRVLKL